MVIHHRKIRVAVKNNAPVSIHHRDAQRIRVQVVGIRVQIGNIVEDMQVFHDEGISLQIPDDLFPVDPVKNK